MVTRGENMRTKIEEVFGNGGRQSEAACSVFRIHDHQVDLALMDQMGQMFADNPPAWTPENVPDKEQFHKDRTFPG